MQNSNIFILCCFLILIFRAAIELKTNKSLNCSNPPKVIDVSHSSKGGSFKSIQSAIESIPKHNIQWVHIRISPGTYTEKVFIRKSRPCIFLEGAGSSSTIIKASDPFTATFESLANDIVAKGIEFKNTYNNPPVARNKIKPALAAKIKGDRIAFYNCSFKGVQDTLFDVRGRHYFKHCYIEGAIDFIFGGGQSIYEKSVINFTTGIDGPKRDGVITAQKRDSINSTSGFVFKECIITGVNTKTQLGRAYGPFSRVIIANSYLTHVVRPEGWSAWSYVNHEENFTYVEENNSGPGANKTNRVPWMKKMDAKELNKFLDISYIDQEGWISKQPITNSF